MPSGTDGGPVLVFKQRHSSVGGGTVRRPLRRAPCVTKYSCSSWWMNTYPPLVRWPVE